MILQTCNIYLALCLLPANTDALLYPPHVGNGTETRIKQDGLTGWNEHIAGGVAANLGEVWVPFMTSQRAGS